MSYAMGDQPTSGSFFGGIGGFELAAIAAGIKPVWTNEIDSFCCKVLRKNFGHDIIEKDINDVNGSSLASADFVSGGFPCQPFAMVGNRRGKDDHRYLWPQMFRLIQETRPFGIIGENVVGLTSMENDTPFEKWVQTGVESKAYLRRIYCRYLYRKRQTFVLNEIIEDLEQEGYTVETYIVPSCGVGAWHKRERVWILAYACRNGYRPKESGRAASAVHSIQENYRKAIQSGQLTGTGNHGTLWADIESNDGGVPGAQNEKRGIWDVEPGVGRVADGVPDRLDRLKGLGNAIVPQVAYEFFVALLELWLEMKQHEQK